MKHDQGSYAIWREKYGRCVGGWRKGDEVEMVMEASVGKVLATARDCHGVVFEDGCKSCRIKAWDGEDVVME